MDQRAFPRSAGMPSITRAAAAPKAATHGLFPGMMSSAGNTKDGLWRGTLANCVRFYFLLNEGPSELQRKHLTLILSLYHQN